MQMWTSVTTLHATHVTNVIIPSAATTALVAMVTPLLNRYYVKVKYSTYGRIQGLLSPKSGYKIGYIFPSLPLRGRIP